MENQPAMGGLTPHLTIIEGRAAEAIDFYGRAFGATVQNRVPGQDGKRLLHAHLTVNNAALMLNDDFPEYRGGKPEGAPAGVTLHLEVDDADRWFERAVAAGAEVVMPVGDQFWGARYGQVRDPFGYRWAIGGPVRK